MILLSLRIFSDFYQVEFIVFGALFVASFTRSRWPTFEKSELAEKCLECCENSLEGA